MSLLEIEDLRVELALRDGPVPVIDGLSLRLEAGRTLCFVGESGCGKSMTALAVMGLLPDTGRVARGAIRLDGTDLVGLPEDRMRAVRGNDVSMIFQEPMTSLNPVYTVGEQIAEVLRRHKGLSARDAHAAAVDLLDAVRIPNARSRVDAYPHEMSGGQRQRVMIAIALACRPKLLIADEPTTALDVTVQAQIFELLRELGRETGTAIILITHDMGAVAEMADDVIVMYAGRGIETGGVDAILDDPRHPYTKGLISCVPHLTADVHAERRSLTEIPGIVPGLASFGADACLFASRCPIAAPVCTASRPADHVIAPGHAAACHFAEETA